MALRILELQGFAIVLGIRLARRSARRSSFTAPSSWSAAMPAGIVDRSAFAASLRRSAEPTHGHRWKSSGMFVLLVAAVIADALIGPIPGPGRKMAELAGHVIVNGVWGAVHDLRGRRLPRSRVAKDGVDTAEIATVFE